MDKVSTIVFSAFICLVVALGGTQTYNTLNTEASIPKPSAMDIYQPFDMSTRSEAYKNVACPYCAYEAQWRETANAPSWIPLSILLLFFGYVGYLFYDDWKFEAPREMFGRYGGYHEL
jgi:hypothetical protein